MAIENNTEMPDPTLAVTCVTTVLAALLSYCLYNGILTTEVENNSILKIARNEFIKNDTTVNGVAWDQYWPLRVLSKYNNDA